MASLALLIWPIVALIIFAQAPLHRAIAWSMLLAYLFLPERFTFDFRGLPPIDKTSVSMIAIMLAIALFAKQNNAQPIEPGLVAPPRAGNDRRFGIVLMGLVAVLLVSPVLTIMDNNQLLVFGDRVLQRLTMRDLISATFESLTLLIPYFVARHYFATPASHRLLLSIIVLGGLIYSVLALIEIRMSPQFHNWVYGYHQHSFVQHIRGGVFRPKIFLSHGLSVGFFFFTAAVCAFALFKSPRRQDHMSFLYKGVWLAIILVLSRNLGATGIALLLIPVLWLRAPLQVKIIKIIALAFLLYPVLRQSGLLPLQQILEAAASVSEDRAGSLLFRFRNEDLLLERALEKPLWGWGGWGRGRIYDEAGRDLSITDGTWIIRLGSAGWLGYISHFGLMVAPLVALKASRKGQTLPIETAALALVLVGNLIYLIPNSTLGPPTWFMAGALAGFVQFYRGEANVTQDTTKPGSGKKPRYTRFSKANM